MKKRILALGLVVLAAIALGGCGRQGAANISSEVAEADPWIEYDSLDEIEELTGFEIEYPEKLGDHNKKDIGFYYCESLNEIEIRYGDEKNVDYIRKAKDDGDISGDYMEYDYTEEADIDGRTVTLKGKSEDSITLATWREDDIAFCVRVEDGISRSDMEAAVSAVK